MHVIKQKFQSIFPIFSIGLLTMLCIGMGSCFKDDNTINDPIEIDITKAIVKGNFTSDAHTTSGKVYVVKNSDSDYTLQLENFNTDAGPDLHIYLATAKDATQFIDIMSPSKNGTYTISITQNVDFTKYKYVLIWCKSFSVLFGSAVLE